jgi:hypothetical protein
VGSLRIRFIEVSDWVAGGISFPPHLPEIFDEFFALGINHDIQANRNFRITFDPTHQCNGPLR